MNFSDATTLFHASLMVSLPTFGWVLAGMVAFRVGLLPQPLNDRISRLSFNFGLPAMLFAGAAGVDYSTLSSARYLLAGVLGTLLILGLSWGYSLWRGHTLAERGVFSHGAFRSNLAIMGLALCISAYGDRGAQLAAMAVAVMTALYNILAVWVLNVSHGTNTSLTATIVAVARNPLIIGIAGGAALSISGLPVPGWMDTAGSWLAAFFLPLMLICVGGAMNVSKLRNSGPLAWESAAWRLLVGPAVTVLIAMLLGVKNESLGVLFLLVATPAAASGYIMVVAARGDGVLAANIVVLTTVFSILTITLGFFALSLMGLVGTVQ